MRRREPGCALLAAMDGSAADGREDSGSSTARKLFASRGWDGTRPRRI